MTPLQIAHDIFVIAKAIYDQAQLVENNKESWKNLVEIIQQIESSLKGLSELPDTENFKLSLMKMQNQLREISVFLKKMCETSYWIRFAFAGIYQRQLADYRQGLVDLVPLLHLGLSAELLIDRDKDRRAALADRAAFVHHQEELLLKKQQEHFQQKRDLEAVMQKQMQAFCDQLEKNWQRKDESVSEKGPLPEDYLVKLYDITFEKKLIGSRVGDIYQATWKNQPVLVKFIEGMFTDTDRDQFIREAKLMSRLHHEALVPFYGACFKDRQMCVVTGRVESTLMSQLGTLSLEERYAMSQELAEGLRYLHQEGIIHNDIHPESIGVTKRKMGKWMDLSWIKTDMISMGSLGIAHDTTLWQAPEIWRHRERVTPASDVYSFGWLLWALYTGRMPFPKEQGSEFLKALKEGRREVIPSDCPDHLCRLITTCWSNDPKERPSLDRIITTLNQPLSPPRPVSPSGEAYYEQGKKAEQLGDLEAALKNYEKSASKDFYKSYNSLGTFALGKSGERKDPKKAERYFKQGANAGHAPAMFNLARLYEKNELKIDDNNLLKALFWYEKARNTDPDERRYQDKVTTITETLRSSGK